MVRSIQIKLSRVTWTGSGVHKGFGFCVMLLTDINETTDSSDWIWIPFNSADFKRIEDVGEGWDGPSWDSWMTDKGVVFCWLDGMWWVKEKKKAAFWGTLQVLCQKQYSPSSWGWMHREFTRPSSIFLFSSGTTKTLAMIRPLAYCVYQAQQLTEVICQILPKSLDFQK